LSCGRGERGEEWMIVLEEGDGVGYVFDKGVTDSAED